MFIYYQKGLIKERSQIKEREFVYYQKGVCLSKVSNQRKGVHEKRKRGKRKTKRKPKHDCKRRGYDNKTNTKTIKNKTNTKTKYNKLNTNTNKRI